ncbi:MAG: trypsin-like peptidase domain-containing protein [bacterium]
MSIELRILGGARAGHSQIFEKSVIAIGRHPMSDLQFDTKKDLDVSTRHGEIRVLDGRYTIHDNQSTNGTFVNGQRVASGGSRELRDGDVIGFGPQGPTVKVHVGSGLPTPHPVPPADAARTRVSSATPAAKTRRSEKFNASDGEPVPTIPSKTPRGRTDERIAIAVHARTRRLLVIVSIAIVLLGGLAAGFYWSGRREAEARDREIESLLAKNDTTSRAFQAQLQGMNDTALTNGLRRRNDSLTQIVRDNRGSKAAADAQARLQLDNALQRKLSRVDFAGVRRANNAAIVFIVSNLGQGLEATGFSVSSAGLIVTNRHVVADSTGRATTITVKFADTGKWLHAHIVRVGEGEEFDLAVLQIDEPGSYPKVRSIAKSVDVQVGDPIVSLGFPLGTDTPMDGSAANTTLTPGTVSKLVPDVLQIDSYATHGSSGSPVFDVHGHVIGVVWGGPIEARGRIVYAVPAERLAALVQGQK